MYVTLHATHKPPKLDLKSVLSLLEYLHALPQESGDRDLSMQEDLGACEELRKLLKKHREPLLQQMIEYYTAPEYKVSRTMCIWYGIARNIADIIQQEDLCCH